MTNASPEPLTEEELRRSVALFILNSKAIPDDTPFKPLGLELLEFCRDVARRGWEAS